FLDGAPRLIDHLLLLRQGFAPGQMNVAMPGGYAHGRIAGTGQPDPRQRVLVHWIFGAAVLHPEVLSLKGKGLAGVVALDVVEKLLGALITPVMVDEVAIGALFRTAASGNDVPFDPPTAQPLQAHGHLSGIGGMDKPGLNRDQHPEPLGFPSQRRGNDPGFLGVAKSRNQRALEATDLSGARHLGEVIDIGEVHVLLARRDPRTGDVIPFSPRMAVMGAASVAMNGQAPEKFNR